MKSKKQQKICYNCNGQVDLEVIVCPFCGTDLLEEFDTDFDVEEEFENKQKSLSPQETIASLYPAPYQPQEKEEETVSTDSYSKNQNLAWMLLIFSMNILSIGLLLFLFSKDGKVHLELNSKYWFLWIIGGIPMVIWSWKKIQEY